MKHGETDPSVPLVDGRDMRDISCRCHRDHMGPIGGSTADNEPIVVEIDC